MVFRYPVNPSLDYIKRLIAKTGETSLSSGRFYDEEAQVKVYEVRVNGKVIRP
ncbi:MAG: hypothetical protein Q9N34_03065 [Aquificota bacterium]|nr:hypothetical protein [Aquificota bacterium]